MITEASEGIGGFDISFRHEITPEMPLPRATADELRASIERVTNSEFLHATMELLGAWVCVLNNQRQVLAVNDAFLRKLGVDDPAGVLGLRPGEVLRCTVAENASDGCGTGIACTSCGAAIAIVASQHTGKPQERECVLKTRSSGTTKECSLLVRSCPFQMDGEQVLLLCMRDISDERRRAALERTFLHDVSNTLTALTGVTELLVTANEAEQPELVQQVREAAETLRCEVRVQRVLARNHPDNREAEVEHVSPSTLLARIESLFAGHPAARGQTLSVQCARDDEPFETDVGLMLRILGKSRSQRIRSRHRRG